ncbi:hypothetical protein B0H14DRAFT_3461738 [Mycena olivaceomarginata]|nr:hypothetical protein B0H14DRAFT_3461738 [Mycena olivaceomarginata]
MPTRQHAMEFPAPQTLTLPRNILSDLLKRTPWRTATNIPAAIHPHAPRRARWNPIQPGAPPRRPPHCKPPPSSQVPQAATCSAGPPVKDETQIPATPFSPPQFPPIFLMFRPYTNTAGQATHRKSKADTAQQEQWLANTNNGGPLPIHEPHQKTAIFDVRDNNPLAAVLRLAQKQLAAANRTRSLLTFERNTTDWTDFEYPYSRLGGFDIYRQPSGFGRMEHAELPLCPHFANPNRTEFECRMMYHTARDKVNGGTIHYLQVPQRHHACSFISILRSCERRELHPSAVKAEIKDEFPDARALLSSQPPPKREPGVKRKSSILATTKEQTLGRRTRPWALRLQLPRRPLKREDTVLSIPGPSRVIIDLDADDDVVIPHSSSPPSSSAASSLSFSGQSPLR